MIVTHVATRRLLSPQEPVASYLALAVSHYTVATSSSVPQNPPSVLVTPLRVKQRPIIWHTTCFVRPPNW